MAQRLIAVAPALGSGVSGGYLHPAPLVAHVEILVVALETSSALHRHLAVWYRRSSQIQVYSSHRLLRAQAAHSLSMSLTGIIRPLLTRVSRPVTL
jgi:hypothetical protein